MDSSKQTRPHPLSLPSEHVLLRSDSSEIDSVEIENDDVLAALGMFREEKPPLLLPTDAGEGRCSLDVHRKATNSSVLSVTSSTDSRRAKFISAKPNSLMSHLWKTPKTCPISIETTDDTLSINWSECEQDEHSTKCEPSSTGNNISSDNQRKPRKSTLFVAGEFGDLIGRSVCVGTNQVVCDLPPEWSNYVDIDASTYAPKSGVCMGSDHVDHCTYWTAPCINVDPPPFVFDDGNSTIRKYTIRLCSVRRELWVEEQDASMFDSFLYVFKQ